MDTTILKQEPENTQSSGKTSTARLTGKSERYSEPIKPVTVLLSIATILLTFRYLFWRLSVNQWQIWWLSAPLLLAELFTALHILGYQYTIWPRRIRPLSLICDSSALPVFIFIPTVNEGAEILGPTIAGAIATRDFFLAKHPKAAVRIIVCNDGLVANIDDWQLVERLSESLGVECITRQQRGGAKAGNIENARQQVGATGDNLLVVLDADQIAELDFLCRTIEPFSDPEVGWVQTRQFYRNTNFQVARWAENQATLFYDLVCPGKSAINASYICGTNVTIRASVLDQIGGFPTDSVTEDFAASIRTHQNWRSVYLKDVLAKGLGPLDVTGYMVQQSRWARGTLGVVRSDWRRLLPSKGGLNFDQRVQYFLSGTHYLCGLRDLIFLSTALVSLYLDTSPIKSVSISTIAWYLVPYILASQILIFVQAGSLSVASGMVIGYISFPTLVFSTLEAMINRKMRFRVTPKTMSKQGDLRAIFPHIFIVGLCMIVLAHALKNLQSLTSTELIPLFWVIYALCLLSPTFVLIKRHPDREQSR
jgi:cellulose synthase/poly-beta-1,6-N-acetylglucosamine synthase-like glycosyltransferase